MVRWQGCRKKLKSAVGIVFPLESIKVFKRTKEITHVKLTFSKWWVCGEELGRWVCAYKPEVNI